MRLIDQSTLLALFVGSLTACAPEGFSPNDPDDAPPGRGVQPADGAVAGEGGIATDDDAFQILRATWRCESDGSGRPGTDIWTLDALANQWISSGRVTIVETADTTPARWAEPEHPMHEIAYDPHGAWGEFRLVLYGGHLKESLIPGYTSFWSCEAGGPERLTWKIEVDNANEDAPSDASDCVTFGHQPRALQTGISVDPSAGGPVPAAPTCRDFGPATNGLASPS